MIRRQRHFLRLFCRRYLKCEPLVIGEPDVDLGIEINVDRPTAVGADRLVNTVAAHERYKGALIVVDFGTATTFDIVSAAPFETVMLPSPVLPTVSTPVRFMLDPAPSTVAVP